LEEIGLKHIKTYDELEKFCSNLYKFILTKNPYSATHNKALYFQFRYQVNRYLVQFLRDFTCQRCGKQSKKQGLHFHHVDPKTKTAKVSSLMKYGWRQALRESLLCLYLCEECHYKEHLKEGESHGNHAVIDRWRHTYIQNLLGSTE
jgi:hypothetical protein